MINPDSELAQRFWREGRLADCPILDFHAHMHDWSGLFLPHQMPEDMLRTMDACNVAMALFCGHVSLSVPAINPAGRPAAGETKDMEAVRRFPDRFRAYHVVMSNYLDPEADLTRMAENPELFVGFKFHPDTYGVPLSDPRHEPYWRYADERGLLVLSHTWGRSDQDGPEEVEKVLREYHHLVLIAGHSFHDDWERGPELVHRYSNLYLELTAVLDNRGALDLLVEKCGSQQILFGTDLPWFSTWHGIGAVLSAEMTDEDRRNVFYRNGEKLLRRFPWFGGIWSRGA